MLSVLIDGKITDSLSIPLLNAFQKFQIVASLWGADAQVPVGTDAVMTVPTRLAEVSQRLKKSSQQPYLVVLASDPVPADSRRMLSDGVAAIVDITRTEPDVQVLVALGAATGGCISIPPLHGSRLAHRLEEPPRQLAHEEKQLLGLAATHSIEAAGRLLGFSRRQIQRRFGRLCDDLELASHLHAAVAAARWGLIDTRGQLATGSDPD